MNSIEEIYRKLSPAVASEIQLHVQMSGTLQHLLKRLQIPPAQGLLNQHKALFEFIRKFGDDIFLDALRRQLTLQEFARLKAQKLSGSQLPDSSAAPIQPFRKPPPSGFSSDTGMFGAASSNPGIKIEAPVVTEGGLASNEYSSQKPRAATTRMVSAPTYHGPDRRSGSERRAGRGRREVITPLFGGERREDDRRHGERRGAGAGNNARGVSGNRRQSDRRKRSSTITFADRRRSGNDRRRAGRG